MRSSLDVSFPRIICSFNLILINFVFNTVCSNYDHKHVGSFQHYCTHLAQFFKKTILTKKTISLKRG